MVRNLLAFSILCLLGTPVFAEGPSTDSGTSKAQPTTQDQTAAKHPEAHDTTGAAVDKPGVTGKPGGAMSEPAKQ